MSALELASAATDALIALGLLVIACGAGLCVTAETFRQFSDKEDKR